MKFEMRNLSIQNVFWNYGRVHEKEKQIISFYILLKSLLST